MNHLPIPVDDLDIESLAPGSRHRLLLTIGHDALGAPLQLPVLVTRGRKPGPVFGVTSALHGNELNGIPVIHRLFQQLDPAKLRGTIVAIAVVNIPGFRTGRRYLEGVDLNHAFPGDPDGATPDVFAHRLLANVVSRFNYLVDFHTASFGRVNSLYIRADMTDRDSAQMAYLLRPQIIVHNPPSDYTLRGAAMENGIPAVTVEIGNPHRFQEKLIQRTVVGMRAVLGHVGMIKKRAVALGAPPVICERSFWVYSDHGGLLEVFPDITEPVREGQRIAVVKDIFGDVVAEYVAPASGVVVGKSVNPVGMTGARIIQLGVVARNRASGFHFRPDHHVEDERD
jgi:predicted deacylase